MKKMLLDLSLPANIATAAPDEAVKTDVGSRRATGGAPRVVGLRGSVLPGPVGGGRAGVLPVRTP